MLKLSFLLFFSLLIITNTAFFRPPDDVVEESIKNLDYIHSHPINFIPPPTYDIPSPKVTIVVPVLDGHKFLEDSLKSFQHQTLKEMEFIFVDDGSTDNTYEMLLDFQKKDKRVQIQKNEGNRGILYSRMSAALKAKGEYIAFMDVDDMYFKYDLLETAYDTAKKYDLDICQFNNYQGNYTKEYGYSTFMVFTTKYREKIDTLIYQPEIKQNFFYTFKGHDLLSGIVYDKLYSRYLIKRMTDIMEEDFWTQNLSYMEDFIMIFSAARGARSYMIMNGIGGVWHWANNPDGMTSHFEVEDRKLKFPKKANKKMADNLAVNEKVFDLVEDESDGSTIIVSMISLMAKSDMHLEIISLCDQAERYMDLMVRYVVWPYADQKEIKEKINKIAWNVAITRKDPALIEKYQILLKDMMIQMGFSSLLNGNEKLERERFVERFRKESEIKRQKKIENKRKRKEQEKLNKEKKEMEDRIRRIDEQDDLPEPDEDL